jgi:hypothetical protein
MLMAQSASVFHNPRNVLCPGATFNVVSGDYIVTDANNESGQYTFLTRVACSFGAPT